MHYNRFIAFAFAVNLVLLGRGLASGGISMESMSNAALANFSVAILIRQQYVINLLFWLATRAPHIWPLRVRWALGNVYHLGGLHVGGAVAGTMWLLALVAVQTVDAVRGFRNVTPSTLAVSYALLALLVTLVATALPSMRSRFHDSFEKAHRFGGWASLALFWTQTVMTVSGRSDGISLLSSPSVWLLAMLTVSIALPWLRLRRVPVTVERPSRHVALVGFGGNGGFPGAAMAISRRPLLEWHSFAMIPNPDGAGFHMAISRAGDWTGSFIDEKPSHVWVKGIPTAGMANVQYLFRKVAYVVTGSGIGPVLPHLVADRERSSLVWVTRNVRATYGDAFVDEVLAAQPEAVIWDTTERGRPDMVQMAYDAYRSSAAEAVVCISNEKLTWEVVHSLEQRGIPAFGAIWDS